MTRLARVSPVAGLHRRRLTFWEVLAQSVSALAPSAAMVTTPAIVLVQSGAATLPAFAAATVLVLLVGWCLTQFARRLAAVGGVYTYTAQGLGPSGALVGGWSLAIGYAAVSMSALVGCALYLAALFSLPASAVAWLVLLVGGLAGWCTVRGIQLSARVALALEVVSIGLVLAVLGVLLLRVSPAAGSAAVVVDGDVRWGGLAIGVVLGVVGFMGFESASVLGVEAQRPLRSVPRAVLWTPAVAGVLFLAGTAAQVVLLRAAPLEVLLSPVPVDRLAAEIGPVAWALEAGIAASFFACVTGSVNALARVLFSMGREGVLASALGRTHGRLGTPSMALLLVLPVVVGVPFVALAGGFSGRGVLTGTLTVSAIGYVVAYVLVCVAMPLFLRRIGELTRAPLVGGVAAAGLWSVVLVVAVSGSGWADGRLAALVYLGALAPGLAWLGWLRLRRPVRLQRVGVYDEPTVASVLPGSLAA
ncbi:APC family permease [Modestobacter roseus]|uniref:APC family permease n=1 Tax=Modestobacter roseus TaxID=1181884 RepID=UPI001885D3B6|nr:APC family permease [Modestobacter roseus]